MKPMVVQDFEGLKHFTEAFLGLGSRYVMDDANVPVSIFYFISNQTQSLIAPFKMTSHSFPFHI
jgi:hypothetical protein